MNKLEELTAKINRWWVTDEPEGVLFDNLLTYWRELKLAIGKNE